MIIIKVNIDFGEHIDTIEFIPFLGKDINKYQKAFEDWFYDAEPSKFGGVVLTPRKDLQCELFDVSVIIKWINELYPNANVKIIAKGLVPGTEDSNLPSMYF